MLYLSFFAALALVLSGTQTRACDSAGCATGNKLAPAECNSVGCVRPTNALGNLVKVSLSTMTTEPANAPSLCGTGNCPTAWELRPLPEKCGSAGCETAEPKPRAAAPAANDGAGIHASTLVTNAFAALAAPSMRFPPAIRWAEWTERWGYGGLYKSSIVH